MKILVASDSFKESMTSFEVATVVEESFKEIDKTTEVIKVPISDGGEGFVDSLVYGTNGLIKSVVVSDSLQNSVLVDYGISGDLKTAFIEMAKANGLEGVSLDERNPLNTSTYGTGQIILDALNQGVERIVIGIGGSSTNDGGAGMARALGVKFLDKNGNELDGSGGSLARLYSIDDSYIDDRIKDVEFIVASDVDNPLVGEKGATKVYAKQKGADDEMITLLESNLRRYAQVIFDKYQIDISHEKGAGAAGGLGAGLSVFTNARFNRGIDIVLEYIQLNKKLDNVDLVITGEGKIDHQTIYGKAPIGVAKLAKEKNIKVIAFCGITGENYEVVLEHGIDEVYSIVTEEKPIELLLKEGKSNLRKAAIKVAESELK